MQGSTRDLNKTAKSFLPSIDHGAVTAAEVVGMPELLRKLVQDTVAEFEAVGAEPQERQRADLRLGHVGARISVHDRARADSGKMTVHCHRDVVSSFWIHCPLLRPAALPAAVIVCDRVVHAGRARR